MMLGPVICQILGSRSPVKTILVLCFAAMQPMNCMSMAFKALGVIFLVSSAWAVELSVCMGVQICGCPISSRVRCMETSVLTLMNNAPSLASAADDITALIICNMLSTALLLMGMSSVPAINMWPQALLQALGSDRYDALLGIASLMSLA
jgi:hypothetical protein